uniref:Uncharacterized protein n=1 Tax=Anguilla anguilla TaxID=7936 RepID=A0A0E9XVJ0_ANGAN
MTLQLFSITTSIEYKTNYTHISE